MPLKVSRFYIPVILALATTGAVSLAQGPPANPQPEANTANSVRTPTSAEVMRDRITKAKAFIAVRNYNAAIYELENIRRETSDQPVQAVTTVLLMNSYLEQGDHKRAQDLLKQLHDQQKTAKPGAAEIYGAVAGQVVKGARSTAERYRALGLSINDRTLPLEAVNNVEQMRETLELVITQVKESGKEQAKADASMALLEEAATSRSALARDDYDARRWNDEMADSREQMASSRSVITNAVDVAVENPGTPPIQTVSAELPPHSQATRSPAGTPLVAKIVDSRPLNQPAAANVEPPENPVSEISASKNTAREEQRKAEDARPKAAEPPKTIVVKSAPPSTSVPDKEGKEAEKTTSEHVPIEVGSLINYATRKSSPIYPPTARSLRASGVVRVEVMVNEKGEVSEVQNASGPTLLQPAAKDAIRKWRFRPFTRDGQPVRAVGFVNFSFTL